MPLFKCQKVDECHKKLYPYVVESEIRIKDSQFMKIQELIESKRRMLLKKQKKLNEITKDNHFLTTVKEDYAKYYHYISEQKREQIKAFQILNKYIQDLSYSGELSKHNIEDAEAEQKKILREVNAIKRELDTIIQDK
jgi:hypothetical protein